MERLDNFIIAKYGTISEERKKAILLTIIGDDALIAIENFPADDKSSHEKLRKKVLDYFKEKKNDTVERHRFHTLVQDDGELFEDFMNRLKAQALKCNFRIMCKPAVPADPTAEREAAEAVYHDVTEVFLKDRIVVGLRDSGTRRRIMREKDLPLQQIIDICKATEVANIQLKKLYLSKEEVTIHANSKIVKKGSLKSSSSSVEERKTVNCKYCGNPHEKGSRNCPAFGRKCTFCQKKNHTDKVCYAKKQREVNTLSEIDDYNDDSDSEEYALDIGTIECIHTEILDVDMHVLNWYEQVLINGTKHTVKIDTGAQANVISEAELQKLTQDILPLQETDIVLSAYGGSKIPVAGKIDLQINKPEHHHQQSCAVRETPIHKTVEFFVVKPNVKTILGLPSCVEMGFVKPNSGGTIDSFKIKQCPYKIDTSSETLKCVPKFENNENSERFDNSQNDMIDSNLEYSENAKCIQSEKFIPPKNYNMELVHNHLKNIEFDYCIESTTTNNFNISDKVNNDIIPGSECGSQEKTHNHDSFSDTEYSRQVMSKFPKIFKTNAVGCIKGYAYDIKVKEDSIPVVIARTKIPFSKREVVKRELDRMENLKVISRVDEPTDWVSSMVLVEKPGKIRLCLDPANLNKCIKREYTHLPTIDEAFSEIGSSKVFSKLDLKDGYWQVELSEESSKLTTFYTPFGRYKYNRLAFGLVSANEIFQKQVMQVFEGCKGTNVVYDDILVHGRTEEEHNENLENALKRAQERGVLLNHRKCKFKLDQVEYLGYIISKEGLKCNPEKVSAITDMPKPTDKKGVQRLLGTLNFLSRFVPNQSTITTPLRNLLRKDVPFNWSDACDKALDKIKQTLTAKPVLGFYDVDADTVLGCDASSHGLGACIMQKGKPIAYASRSLTPTQQQYAQIEKELLAIVFGCERLRQYIYGKEIIVLTDHKPLLSIFNKPLQECPKRTQRLLLRLQCFNLTLKFVPGKELYIPDMLSRAHVGKESESEKVLCGEADYAVNAVVTNVKCSEEMMSKLKLETKNDVALELVKSYIETEWPESISKCHELARKYYGIRAELVLFQGLILFHDRIVIPDTLRANLLARVHIGHQGRERCKRLARSAIYWPGLNRDIDNMVDKCEPCLLRRNARPREPLRPHEIPNRPWQKIGIDIFHYGGRSLQLMACYFSKWVEVNELPRIPTSNNVIKVCKESFGRFGIAETIFSDGDPLYTSKDFSNFCKEYECNHIFSSAGNSQSNGQIERKIQHIKKVLAKCIDDNSDFYLALLAYRTTPLTETLPSPAVILMNRNLRTKMPGILPVLESDKIIRENLVKSQDISKRNYDKKTKNPCVELHRGEKVRYRDSARDRTWKPAKIVSARSPEHRSYQLMNEQGNIINRNNRFILQDKTKVDFTLDPDDCVTDAKLDKPNPIPISSEQHELPIPDPVTLVADQTPNPTQPPPRRSDRARKQTQFYVAGK